MCRTNSKFKTEIPCTNSRFKAIILKEPSANKLKAIKELKAINSTSNTKRINLKRDLQITSSSNE